MKVVSQGRMCKILETRGWWLERSRGPHYIYKHATILETIAIGKHPGEDLKRGTQRAIMRQAGLIEADLV